MIKYSNKKKLHGERVYFGSQFEGTVLYHCREAAGHIISTGKRDREKDRKREINATVVRRPLVCFWLLSPKITTQKLY